MNTLQEKYLSAHFRQVYVGATKQTPSCLSLGGRAPAAMTQAPSGSLLLLPSSSPPAMTATTNNVDAIQEDRLVELTEMERNNSEMTDDSPFTSALTTPVDQDVPINVFQGIHEALARDMDGSAVDSYFDSKAVGKGADIAQVSQQLEEGRVVEVEVSFMLLSTAEPFYSHPLDSPRRSVGTGGDVGPGSNFGPVGNVSARNNVILRDVVVIGGRRHDNRQAFSFPVIPRTESYDLEAASLTLSHKEDRVEPPALRLEGSPTVPQPSDSGDLLPRAFSSGYISQDDTSSPYFSSPDIDTQPALTVDDAYPTGLEPNIDPKVTPSSVLTDDHEPRYPDFVFHAVAMSAIHVIFFLPWCVAAGAMLLLFPHRLELVIFETGYLEPSKSNYRFAHFAECGMQYSMTFLASLLLFICEYPNLGTVITGGLLALFFHAWQDFEVDRDVPLGHDDPQMIYILATSSWLTGDTVGIQKVEDQYYLSSATLKNRKFDVFVEKDSDEE
ncbi:uncharacterized protein LACBIDRAFT_333057 [Laccaria bicolor S238N-H82]|uniref:Predicted protein n=1 Tax=Laccaria bicolor (strain S238N-H82 / ATCC MYA-4686) TaxID=486041 RepID=B0DUQ2_LACBS|nr:uncharacterized protein LACBIDRAFT_333057 [Laccaria bicolor S238N-H82]EDR01581.1 predicted protein [Laccaria bicolor S238N-H82]|eukprot:XP_001887657.1 predicted protein [Laccaria bicolor S238N-H82]